METGTSIRAVEYYADVLPEGYLSVPDAVRKELALTEGARVRVLLLIEEEDEAWLEAPEWQARLQEAEEDVRQGRVEGPFDSAETLIQSLRS